MVSSIDFRAEVHEVRAHTLLLFHFLLGGLFLLLRFPHGHLPSEVAPLVKETCMSILTVDTDTLQMPQRGPRSPGINTLKQNMLEIDVLHHWIDLLHRKRQVTL